MNDNKVLPFRGKAKNLSPEEQAEIDARKETEAKFAEMNEKQAAGAPCDATIKLCEHLLAAAKNGEISGVAAIAYNEGQKGFNRYNCMNRGFVLREEFHLFAAILLANLELLRSDLSSIAFYQEQARLMSQLSDEIGEEL